MTILGFFIVLGWIFGIGLAIGIILVPIFVIHGAIGAAASSLHDRHGGPNR